MKKEHVWIVEMVDNGRWMPTVGCSLNRISGRKELKRWREMNPPDTFRLRKYFAG